MPHQFLHKIRWSHMDFQGERLVLGEVARRWIKLEEMKLAPSTLVDCRSIMNYHVLPHFGNWFIDQIKPVDVEEFMATRECGAKRINNILAPLRSLFKMAKKNDFVERNIMLDVENLPVDRPLIRPLSMAEVVCFLNALKDTQYRNFSWWRFSPGCGWASRRP
jgi:site-specific recombinase XerD